MPLGITSCLYFNSGGLLVPVWGLVDLISDLKIGSDWNKGESSVRRGRVQTNEPTNLALMIEGKIRKSIADAAYLILRSAHLTGGLVDVLCLDGPKETNGSDGYRFFGKVFSFSEDQALQNVIFKEFSIEPSMEAPIVPQLALVGSGGSITYSPFGG